jgi:hypothetical protein
MIRVVKLFFKRFPSLPFYGVWTSKQVGRMGRTGNFSALLAMAKIETFEVILNFIGDRTTKAPSANFVAHV